MNKSQHKKLMALINRIDMFGNPSQVGLAGIEAYLQVFPKTTTSQPGSFQRIQRGGLERLLNEVRKAKNPDGRLLTARVLDAIWSVMCGISTGHYTEESLTSIRDGKREGNTVYCRERIKHPTAAPPLLAHQLAHTRQCVKHKTVVDETVDDHASAFPTIPCEPTDTVVEIKPMINGVLGMTGNAHGALTVVVSALPNDYRFIDELRDITSQQQALHARVQGILNQL